MDEVDVILRDVNSSMFDNQERLASIVRRAIVSREEVMGLLKWWFTDNMERITEYAGLVGGEDQRKARRILEIVEGK
jgi:hypothetical protein